jgi:hypothetical protein
VYVQTKNVTIGLLRDCTDETLPQTMIDNKKQCIIEKSQQNIWKVTKNFLSLHYNLAEGHGQTQITDNTDDS